MSYIAEAFHHRNAEGLRDVPRETVLEFVLESWDREANAHTPDFDRLFNAGYVSQQLCLSEVENRLKNWIHHRKDDDPNTWDVAACFLMAYWPPLDDQVDEELVAMLLQALESFSDQEGIRDSTIVALDHAHRCLKHSPLRERIESQFRRLWKGRDQTYYQPTVLHALQRVVSP